MKKLYGSLDNRLMEGRTVPEITVGMDITMFYWSDREVYYVTKVIDQKHIFVKKYLVCADKESNGWKYFKTNSDMNDYLKQFGESLSSNQLEQPEVEWVYRNNCWKSVTRWTPEDVQLLRDELSWFKYPSNFTEKDREKLDSGKQVSKFHKLEPISFDVRDYYYDYEF